MCVLLGLGLGLGLALGSWLGLGLGLGRRLGSVPGWLARPRGTSWIPHHPHSLAPLGPFSLVASGGGPHPQWRGGEGWTREGPGGRVMGMGGGEGQGKPSPAKPSQAKSSDAKPSQAQQSPAMPDHSPSLAWPGHSRP